MSKADYYSENKPMEVDVRPNARYRVQSRSDPETKHLIKWIASSQSYTCSCRWMTLGAGSKDPNHPCAHILEIKKRFAKVCNLCSFHGELTVSMIAPWKHENKEVTLFLCDNCDAFLSEAYRRGVSK